MPACRSDAEPPSTTSPVIVPETSRRGASAFFLNLLFDISESALPPEIDAAYVEHCCLTSLRSQDQLALPDGATIELSLQVLDSDAMQSLNRDFRGRDRPTNVLSFPSGLPEMIGDDEVSDDAAGAGTLLVLGDLVLCPPVLSREAAEQGKPLKHHWAHMLVHGCLHLCGHDHEDPQEADAMEGEEIRILSILDIPDPYSVEHDVDGQ